jgi:hypothetical protein
MAMEIDTDVKGKCTLYRGDYVECPQGKGIVSSLYDELVYIILDQLEENNQDRYQVECKVSDVNILQSLSSITSKISVGQRVQLVDHDMIVANGNYPVVIVMEIINAKLLIVSKCTSKFLRALLTNNPSEIDKKNELFTNSTLQLSTSMVQPFSTVDYECVISRAIISAPII